MSRLEPHAESGGGMAVGIRTFLFADLRGYTRYTQEHGDEAASTLAARFADIVRDTVPEFDGELLELRGDEALCVFSSARQALRTSIELQRWFRKRVDGEPVLPLAVGMGLDAGEAVPTEGGYRGGALNIAARLCALAAPGQVLATDTVVALARRVEGLRFQPRRAVRVKGVAEPVRLVEVVPEASLPPVPMPPAAKRTAIWRRWIPLGVGLAILVGVFAGVVLGRGGGTDRARPFAGPAVYAVDATSGTVERGIKLTDRPSAVAVGGGAMWIAEAGLGVVERVDPATGRSSDIPVGADPVSVVWTPAAVWVANSGDGTVTRIGRTGRAVPFYIGNGPTSLVAHDGAIWVTLAVDDTVVRLDPADGRVLQRIPAGPDPTAAAVGRGRLWVTNESRGEVTPIDLATGHAEAPIAVGAGPNAVVASADDVWVANTLSANVTDIDPSKEQLRQTYLLNGNPISLVRVPGGVLAVTASGAVWRIDTSGARQLGSLRVAPQSAVTAGPTVWVAATPPPAEHHGGTLVFAYTGDESPIHRGQWTSIDPASPDAYSYMGATLLAMTNDGLVAFKRVGGADGGTVVPDLAQAIPAPTRGGRSWTFHIRPGIRYSTGVVVQPSDFRRGIERAFLLGAGITAYYDRIVGAKACTTNGCDLSRGIVADDSTGTVTFNLTSPDPEFLYHLALSFADAVPRSVPNRDMGARPIPATGPYMFAKFDPRTGASLLVRNPDFHQWSRDAQPSGYPDRIQVRTYASGRAAFRAIEHDRADWMYAAVPLPDLREAEYRYPTRFHPATWPVTSYLQLATTRPPFDRRQARLAVGLAVNRKQLITINAAQGQTEPTCQLAPPNLFGYAPACPHAAPEDTAAARHDVVASGTVGMRVTVEGRPDDPYMRSIFSALRQIGYDPVWKATGTADVAPSGFFADYPSVAFLFERAQACLGYCSRHPALGRLIHRAQSAELSAQPGRAGPLWAAAEKLMLRLGSPWVPLSHPLSTGFVSKRVGNYQFAPASGDAPLLDQMWVK
jgi:peptide/nickel transport system substrate-binding protein